MAKKKSKPTKKGKPATKRKKGGAKKKAAPPSPIRKRTTYANIPTTGTSTADVTQAITNALGANNTDVFGSDNFVNITVQKQGGG